MLNDARYLRKPTRRSQPSGCWGAQCVLTPPTAPTAPRRESPLRLASAALTTMMLFALWLALPKARPQAVEVALVAQAQPQARAMVRDNRLIGYQWPQHLPVRNVVFTRNELLHGKLLLIDDEHRVPHDAPAPNTLSVAQHGQGMVPVRDLAVKCGRETLDALYAMFAQLRMQGVEGLAITRGTLSEREQLALQLERMEALATRMSLPDAATAARNEVADPGASEHQLPFSVDIRVFSAYNAPPDERAPAATEQGRALLQLAWRYGFVHRYPGAADNACRAHEFRFVGVAHATAMAYLALPLEDYLALLHERSYLVVYAEGGAPAYLIACTPMYSDYAELPVPDNAALIEVSLDNMGYAVIACTMEQEAHR